MSDEPEPDERDLELDDDAADEVVGGARPVPPPSGPLPVPYPNL